MQWAIAGGDHERAQHLNQQAQPLHIGAHLFFDMFKQWLLSKMCPIVGVVLFLSRPS
jgi:hypothetical protein